MRKALLLVLVFVCSVTVRASDVTPDPLPEPVLAHISIQSPGRLLEAVDAFAAAVTAATKNEIAPGMLTFLAQMYNPLSEEMWDLERDTHLIVPAYQPSRNVMLLMPTRLAFEDFLEELRGMKFQVEAEENGYFQAQGQGMPPFLLTESDDGYVLVVNSEYARDMAETMAEHWEPRHWGSGVLNAHVNLPNGWVEYSGIFDELDELLERAANGDLPGADELRAQGLDPETVDMTLRMMEMWLPPFKRELAAFQSVALEIDLDGERLTVASHLIADPDSMADKLAANAGKLGALDMALARNIDAGAAGMFVFSDFLKLIPDLPELVDAMYSEMAEIVEAKNADAARAAQTELFKYLDGGSAFSLHSADKLFEYRFWMHTSQADKFLDAYVGLIRAMNDIIRTGTLGASYPVQYLIEDKKAADGLAYKKVDIKFDIDAWMQTLPNQENQQAVRDMMEAMANTVILMAPAGEGMVAGVTGQVDEDDLRRTLELAKGAKTPWIDVEAVKETMDLLPDRAIGLGVFDVDQLFAFAYGMAMETLMAAQDDDLGDLYKQAWDTVKAQLRTSEQPVGFSLGQRGGNLVTDFTITASALNAVVYNSGLFQDTFNAMLYQHILENNEELELDGDEDYMDDEDNYNEDEDEDGEEETAPAEGIDAA